ncbi:hypothetical protein [Streptomyces sp. ADI95-16]|uniref:hypothetical protein n=1 Tax=Streptomyces sp. ADI95-16 TaxID=1522758 RepID=UPI0020B39252|nr:hypothetical protein [Streptomyces sp. ADI95-16]
MLTGAAAACALTTLVIWRWISETAPATGKDVATGPRAMLRGYLAVGRDRLFLRQLTAAALIAAVEMQIGYYIAVRLADEFPRQTLATIGSWAPAVDGVAILGILRAVNAALVVAPGPGSEEPPRPGVRADPALRRDRRVHRRLHGLGRQQRRLGADRRRRAADPR